MDLFAHLADFEVLK